MFSIREDALKISERISRGSFFHFEGDAQLKFRLPMTLDTPGLDCLRWSSSRTAVPCELQFSSVHVLRTSITFSPSTWFQTRATWRAVCGATRGSTCGWSESWSGLSYGQLQESCIISGLQWRNVNEYRLPSKNARSPNYCSWLAVCVNHSANFLLQNRTD